MFWIYGGALKFGNAGQPAYDGNWLPGLADVVVVTVNYRTNGVFSSPSPCLEVSVGETGRS